MSAGPKRIKRERTKGWRKPEGVVYVGRGSGWGNHWREGDTSWTVLPGGWIDKTPHPPLTREQAIESYRNSMCRGDPEQPRWPRPHVLVSSRSAVPRGRAT